MPRQSSAAALVIGLAVLLGACSSNGAGGHPGLRRVISLQVDIDSCGKAWSSDRGGALTFALTNRFYNPMDAYLTNAATGAYLAEYEGIGTGATLDRTVSLGNGSYRFVCFPADEPDVVGPTATITDASRIRGTAQVAPVSTADLIAPSQSYKRWIASRLPLLGRQTAALAAAVRSGAGAEAKADWLRAHLTYETLGAAYDAFSSGAVDYDGLINPSPRPGVDPATDPELTGFHKLEALLWSGAPVSRLVPAADALLSAVSALVKDFERLDIEPNDLPLRAHEIVENAIQQELNAETDAGSHTNLATAWANLVGAQHALVELGPILRERYPDLAVTQQALASAKTMLESLKHGGAADGWPSPSSLGENQRARVNGSFQRAAELLAPVAAICDVRNVVQP